MLASWLGILDLFSFRSVLFMRLHLLCLRLASVIRDWLLRLGHVLFELALLNVRALLILLNNRLVIFIGDCRKR